jgi:acyl carrier protein
MIEGLADYFCIEPEEMRAKILADPSLSFLENEYGADSLDIVDLMMELEEEFEDEGDEHGHA